MSKAVGGTGFFGGTTPGVAATKGNRTEGKPKRKIHLHLLLSTVNILLKRKSSGELKFFLPLR